MLADFEVSFILGIKKIANFLVVNLFGCVSKASLRVYITGQSTCLDVRHLNRDMEFGIRRGHVVNPSEQLVTS